MIVYAAPALMLSKLFPSLLVWPGPCDSSRTLIVFVRCRLLSVEAADAPSTPTAEAKRPGRSAGAEAPAESACATLNTNAQLADAEGASASASGHAAQDAGTAHSLPAAVPLEEALSNGDHAEPAAAEHHSARPSSSAVDRSEQDLEPSAERSFEDGVTSSSRPGIHTGESQLAAAPEAAHDLEHANFTELKRQRSLEREAHFAQVRLALPLHTSPVC